MAHSRRNTLIGLSAALSLACGNAYASPREQAEAIMFELEVTYHTASLLYRMCNSDVVRWSRTGDRELEATMTAQMYALGLDDEAVADIVKRKQSNTEDIEKALADWLDARGMHEFSNVDFGSGHLLNIAPSFTAGGLPVPMISLCEIAVTEMKAGSAVGKLFEPGDIALN